MTMTESEKAAKYETYLARQREHSRKYRKAHRAEVAAYFRQWYQKNKAKVAIRRRQKRLQAQGLDNEAK